MRNTIEIQPEKILINNKIVDKTYFVYLYKTCFKIKDIIMNYDDIYEVRKYGRHRISFVYMDWDANIYTYAILTRDELDTDIIINKFNKNKNSV